MASAHALLHITEYHVLEFHPLEKVDGALVKIAFCMRYHQVGKIGHLRRIVSCHYLHVGVCRDVRDRKVENADIEVANVARPQLWCLCHMVESQPLNIQARASAFADASGRVMLGRRQSTAVFVRPAVSIRPHTHC